MAFLCLLPVRPRPLKDENLDSWVIRLAHANGTTAKYFGDRVLELKYSCQLDDCDDAKIFKALELATGLSYSEVVDTTFSRVDWKIQGKVYCKGKETVGLISFHQVGCRSRGLLKYTHRVCPLCWKDDEIPYVRKQWRLRFWRTCPKHKIFLIEKCQICGNTFKSSYGYHSSVNNYGKISLYTCPSCGKAISHQYQHFDNQGDFAVADTLQRFYNKLLETKTFSCEDAIAISGLRRISRAAFDMYPPVTVSLPSYKDIFVPYDVTKYY